MNLIYCAIACIAFVGGFIFALVCATSWLNAQRRREAVLRAGLLNIAKRGYGGATPRELEQDAYAALAQAETVR